MAAPNTATSTTKTTELSDAEFRATFSILPHVLKLTKSLYNNADTQTIHQTVRRSHLPNDILNSGDSS